MRSLLIAATAASVALPTVMPAPALAAPHPDRKYERKVNKAERQYNRKVRQAQRQRIRDWRQARRYDYNRLEPGYNRYYADRYYRAGDYYADRRLTRYDRIYRGQDGRYYCRRKDGTTGLIIGAGLGALAGSQLNIGGSRTLSTILGGAAGALIGRQLDRGNLRCN